MYYSNAEVALLNDAANMLARSLDPMYSTDRAHYPFSLRFSNEEPLVYKSLAVRVFYESLPRRRAGAANADDTRRLRSYLILLAKIRSEMTQMQAHTDKEFVVLARNTEPIRTAAVTRAYRAVSNTSEVVEYFTRVSTTNAAVYTMLYRVFEMGLPGIIYMPYLEKFLATYAVYAETKAVEKRAAKEQVKNDETKSGQSKPSKTRSHTAFIQSNSSLNSGITDFVRRNEASFLDRRTMNDDDLIPAAPPPIGPDARASAAFQWQQDLDSLLNNARANDEEEE